MRFMLLLSISTTFSKNQRKILYEFAMVQTIGKGSESPLYHLHFHIFLVSIHICLFFPFDIPYQFSSLEEVLYFKAASS